jgi:glycogen synthase
MVQQAMSGDYSWTRSAKTYETLYEAILEER